MYADLTDILGIVLDLLVVLSSQELPRPLAGPYALMLSPQHRVLRRIISGKITSTQLTTPRTVMLYAYIRCIYLQLLQAVGRFAKEIYGQGEQN